MEDIRKDIILEKNEEIPNHSYFPMPLTLCRSRQLLVSKHFVSALALNTEMIKGKREKAPYRQDGLIWCSVEGQRASCLCLLSNLLIVTLDGLRVADLLMDSKIKETRRQDSAAARMERWNQKFCSNCKQLDLLWAKLMEGSRIRNQQLSQLLHQQAKTLKMCSLSSPLLNSMTTFDRWEQSMEDNSVRSKLSDWLYTKFHPSTDFKANIGALLGALLSRKVARQFHWSGRHGKRSFGGIEIQYLLFDVIRAKFPSATDYDIEGPVKKWLKRVDFLHRQKTNAKPRPTTLTPIRRQKVKQLLVRELGKKSVKNSVRGQKPKTKVVIY